MKDVARKKLMLLDATVDLNDLRALPGNRLELLDPRHAEVYSIRINKQWRICFTWTVGGAENVHIIDYH